MKMNLKKPYTLFCLLTTMAVFPTMTMALDLGQAIELAKKNDAAFQAEKLDARADNISGWRSVAEMGPRIAASYKYLRKKESYIPDDSTETDTSIELEDQQATIDDGEITVSLNQPIIDLAKLNTARQGFLEMDIATVQLKKAEENLIVRVVERYFGVLAAKDEVDLANSKSQALAELFNKSREIHRLGLGLVSDQYDVEARYQLALASKASAVAKLEDARESLSELLGITIVDDLQDHDNDSILSIPEKDIDFWLSFARENNVDLRLKKLQADAKRLNVTIARSKFLPVLNFYAEYEKQEPDDGLDGYGWERETTEFGLKLEMELLSGGRDVADYMARKARYRAAREHVTASRRSVSRSVKSVWNTLRSKRQMIDAYRKAASAGNKSLEVVQAGYHEGLHTLLDVLNAQRDYFISKSQYQKAGYDFLVESIKFKQVAGALGNQE